MRIRLAIGTLIFALAACSPEPEVARDYYGTLEPFASEAVYFAMTDRFVDGDPTNNHEQQGGGDLTKTFDRPIHLDGEQPANIGYLGGDFRGILNNVDYLADMGFTALWITPIVDNPDEAFTGSMPPGSGFSADRGKTGFHGYWGVNFFVVDEHLESEDLSFANFTQALREQRGIKLILDVVNNHGSPAFTMPELQAQYGKLYDAAGTLVADHQNLHPGELDPDNPLHAFYNTAPDLAELSDFDSTNPDVLEYFVAAHLQWIEQGAAAFRIDTIKHMPHAYWQQFAERIHEEHPGLFMFSESWSFDAEKIAEHTLPKNGGISVLDFPGQQAMNAVFADDAPYSELQDYLHLESWTYQNPYELMTFYDNHDMTRLNADANGFMDANNWLFTSRGIPVVYYGSEIAFRAGTSQHGGNRDYFGQRNIDLAKNHRIHYEMSAIANARKNSPALQRGLQLNLEFNDDTAVFYRIYQHDGETQTALVMLNKSDESVSMLIDQWSGPPPGAGWLDAITGNPVTQMSGNNSITVNAHSVRVLIADWLPTDPRMLQRLDRLHAAAERD